ncbi:signal peptidase II [Rhodoferax sp.]|uniref:signal peptidase II n=1 Tax=Rhodoferax sp. TaxID=50421 RepID=UPI002ACD2223|nr:signal peptidase II [Rhodoferax sp.]MDZ7919204.1 signal peptidase II [Rhodoferax sp.]
MAQAFWRVYPRWVWIVVVLALVSLDQITKVFFASIIPLGGLIEVTSWFNFVHVLNTGAAFSILADAGGWQRWFFISISVLVVLPITVLCLLRKIDPAERWIGAGVVAGGSGNLIDRVQTGAVIDFLDLHWKALHWPAFNLADVFVVCAMLVWVGLSFSISKRQSAGLRKGGL